MSLHFTKDKRLPNNINLRQYCLPGYGAWPLFRPAPQEIEKYLTCVQRKIFRPKIVIQNIWGLTRQRLVRARALLNTTVIMKTLISYLEVEDDGPDEAEGELGVAVDDVLAADVDQLDLLVPQEPQSGLYILDCVKPHPTSLPRLENR